MDKKFIGTDYQDLPRGDRLKIKHSIANAAFDTLIAHGSPMVGTELVGHLSQGESAYSESIIYYGLQSGISRGLLRWDGDGTIQVASAEAKFD